MCRFVTVAHSIEESVDRVVVVRNIRPPTSPWFCSTNSGCVFDNILAGQRRRTHLLISFEVIPQVFQTQVVIYTRFSSTRFQGLQTQVIITQVFQTQIIITQVFQTQIIVCLRCRSRLRFSAAQHPVKFVVKVIVCRINVGKINLPIKHVRLFIRRQFVNFEVSKRIRIGIGANATVFIFVVTHVDSRSTRLRRSRSIIAQQLVDFVQSIEIVTGRIADVEVVKEHLRVFAQVFKHSYIDSHTGFVSLTVDVVGVVVPVFEKISDSGDVVSFPRIDECFTLRPSVKLVWHSLLERIQRRINSADSFFLGIVFITPFIIFSATCALLVTLILSTIGKVI